jgi:hypothetical protein
MDGMAIQTDREPEETLTDLKEHLETKHGFKKGHQRLYHEGNELVGPMSLCRHGDSQYSYQSWRGETLSCWTGFSQFIWPDNATRTYEQVRQEEPQLELHLFVDKSLMYSMQCRPASTHKVKTSRRVGTRGEHTTLKILAIGDSCTGKSSALLQYVDGTFDPRAGRVPTIGIDFKIKVSTGFSQRSK